MSISLSALDSQRFGIVTARADATEPGDVARYDAFCKANDVQLLIVRCPTTATEIVQALERECGLLMDCTVYYRRDLRKHPLQDLGGLDWIRAVRPEDVAGVGAVAARAFARYGGHYHADPHLKREAADEAYRDWAIRSCTEEGVADQVFAAWNDDTIVGFATVRRNSPQESELVLGAVSPDVQGRGIFNALIAKGLHWSREAGTRWAIGSTRIVNITVQRDLVRNGFAIRSSYFMIHKWYDR